MKIAITSLWYCGDYSDTLGAWALCRYLDMMGHNPVLLNKPIDLWTDRNDNSNAMKFINRNCDVLPVFEDREDYNEFLSEINTFICSGRQIWNYPKTISSGHYFYLDFIPNSKKKIAFSTGFSGKYTMPSEYYSLTQYYINAFTELSVGSVADADILKRDFDVKASVVCDPMFLMSAADYMSLVSNYEENDYEDSENFIAVVINDKDMVKSEIIEETSEYLGINIKDASNAEIEDYLRIIAKSDSIITDSYTAAVIAIIFNKPFAILTSPSDADNNKLIDLLNTFGLQNLLLDNNNKPKNYKSILGKPSVPYQRINPYIEYLVKKSSNWLSDVLDVELTKKAVQREDLIIPEMQYHLNKQNVTWNIVDYKIQNLIFPDCDWKNEHWWMMHRGERLKYSPSDNEPTWTLKKDYIECFTYFNSLSVRKWDRYTNALKYKLHLKIKGKFWFQFYGHWLEPKKDVNGNKSTQTLDERLNEIRMLNIGDIQKRDLIHKVIREAKIKKEEFTVRYYDSDQYVEDENDAYEFVFPAEYEKSSVLGFVITAALDSECVIYGGYWSAECLEGLLNTVDISLCTTTYNREEYVTENINLLKNEILFSPSCSGMDEISNHFYINVVDNGRTLDVDEYNSYRLKIHPNPNTGGAGGFTRGMIETLELRERNEFNATHMILMDDDVVILTESLKRTYALLRLMKNEYKDHFISGSMLFLEHMNKQQEDLGFMSEDLNACIALKPEMEMHLYQDVLRNEEDFSVQNEYAGWWYCCIPMKYIRHDNLSLPLFYRSDDIEFSIRNKAKFISLNGIGIWHTSFWVKFNDCLEYYLFLRNYLFTKAVSGVYEKIDVYKRMDKLFFTAIRCFHYIGAEFILDAYEDYLKGPDFFMHSNAEKVVKEHLAKNEKMQSLASFNVSVDVDNLYDNVALHENDLRLYISSNNGHELPDYLLKDDDKIPSIHYILFESPGKQFLRKKVLFVNPHNKTAVLRIMDKEKYKNLIGRYNELIERYKNENEALVDEYRKYAAELYSSSFWKGYYEENE